MRLALVALFALAAVPAVAAEDPAGPDFRITIAADGEVTIDAPAGMVAADGATPGAEHRFRVTLPDDYVVGEIRVLGAYDVARVRQILPLWQNRTGLTDDHFFVEVPHLDFASNPLVNFGGTPQDARVRVGLAARDDELPPAARTLILRRDVSPPQFEVGEVRDLASALGASTFQLTTRTPLEYSFADLQIRKVGASDWVLNPTTLPALEQTFPVQGLDDDSEYEWRVVFRDWSGNEVVSDVFVLATPPSAVPPQPVVRALAPAPGAQIGEERPTLRASFASPESPIDTAGIRMFLDKREVTGFAVDGENVTWTPPTGLAAGLHTVSVEVPNEAGGRGVSNWTFTIAASIPAPPLLVLLALALLAAVAARRP